MAEFGWAYVAGGALTGAVGPTGSIQLKKGDTELTGSPNLIFNTGSNTLEITGDISASVNISASYFYGDGSNLTNVGAELTVQEEGVNVTTAATTINFVGAVVTASAVGSVVTVNVNTSSGGSVAIGPAEDGSYADGLWTDFTTSTLIGTAVDRINEILKIIVPGPAPAVSRKNYTNSDGLGPKLSIDSVDSLAGYSNVANIGDFSDSLAKNSEYSASTSGNDFRLGVYEKDTNIVGDVNFHVVEQLKTTEVNYSNKAFGNAQSGSLKLEVNGAVVHTLNLTASGAGNPNTGSASDLNSTGSGFTNLSITSSARDQNGNTYDIFQHRTANYIVHTDDQRNGWNYSRVIHTYEGTDYETNYVQWYNDTGGSSTMSSPTSNLTFVGEGSKYLSGIEYFRSASLEYTADISNFYFATYPTGNVITFVNNVRCDAPSSQAASELGVGENYNTTLKLTSSTSNNTDSILNDTISLQSRVTHHFKPTFTGAGASVSGVLIYNVDTANSNTNQNFALEDYRITSGSYDSQGSVTDGAATWSSQNHMTASGATGHEDGLAFYNAQLVSPTRVVNSGDPSSLANGPSGNPDYSAITGTRTFYRKIQNTDVSAIRDMKITTYKSSRINNSALSTNNVNVFIKLPNSTGWMDISQDFVYGSYSDGDGALIADANDNVRTGATDTAQSVHCVTFGTNEVANGEHVVIKVIADAAWTGYFSRMVFQLGASDVSDPTQAPDLDFIDFSGLAGVDANLSFGAGNLIDGYTNVTASSISLTDVDFNETFVDNFNARRGVFDTSGSINGTLNQDISSNTPSYPADAFGNAYTGSLVLEVNGVEVHTIDLTSTLNSITNDFNGNSSGFSVSAVAFSETTDDIADYTKPYRTGTYQIGTNEQRVGWNNARVIHRIDSDTTTNYIEWVIDPSGSIDNTAISGESLSDFGHTDVYYQSGIGYYASNPTASFSFEGANFYNNVYSEASNAIRFPTQTNCIVSNATLAGSGLITTSSASGYLHYMPVLDGTADCETTEVQVTGSITFDGGGIGANSISGGLGLFTDYDASVSGYIFHPLKSPITSTTQTKTAFMVYSGSIGSTTLTANEYFGLETYRIVSGNYADQAATTSSANTWDSTTAMNNGGNHDDGMVTANGYLISPKQIGVAGDTGNAALQAPAGNPDYSTLTTGTRSYYRMFQYTGVTTVSSFTLTLYGDATLRSISPVSDPYYAALGANKNVNVEFKVAYDPNYSGADDQSTGWADVAKIFDAGNQPNNDGAGIRSGASSGEDVTIDSGGLALSLTLGTRRVKTNQYFIIKVTADEDWTGYLSRIQVAL